VFVEEALPQQGRGNEAFGLYHGWVIGQSSHSITWSCLEDGNATRIHNSGLELQTSRMGW